MTEFKCSPTAERRFWARVHKTPECWLWTGGTSRGYGQLSWGSPGTPGRTSAYRFAYELLVGPVPEGMQLDHLCRVRNCVNPAHLEPVTCQVNVLRGIGPSATNAAKSHCAKGHPLAGENLVVNSKGQRICLECRRRSGREAARKRAALEGRIAQKARTHCPRGHEYSPDNTYVYPRTGHRRCRRCHREDAKHRSAKLRICAQLT